MFSTLNLLDFSILKYAKLSVFNAINLAVWIKTNRQITNKLYFLGNLVSSKRSFETVTNLDIFIDNVVCQLQLIELFVIRLTMVTSIC